MLRVVEEGDEAKEEVRSALDELALEGARRMLKWENAQAECRVRDGQFIVTKRSTARTKEVDSLADGYRNLRRELREKQVLTEAGNGLLQFTVDYPFDSPSAAASVVTGTKVNGRVVW